LASLVRVAHVSTGELLRDEARRASPLGQQARDYMDAGHLVPDSLILHLVEHHLANTLEDGFVLDGFPRTSSRPNGSCDRSVVPGSIV